MEFHNQLFPVWEPNMSGSKSFARGTPLREWKTGHTLFLLFSQAVRLLFFPFHLLCSFPFLASDVVDLVPI